MVIWEQGQYQAVCQTKQLIEGTYQNNSAQDAGYNVVRCVSPLSFTRPQTKALKKRHNVWNRWQECFCCFETISPKMDWLIDWLIDYWNLQKQVWWEFTARKNAGISEKFLRGIFTEKFSGKVFGKFCRKFYREILTEKKFTGEMGEPGLDWDLESCWSVTAPVEGHRFTSFSRFT